MRDEIVRAMTGDGYVKAVAITGRDLVERARNIHTLLPMATAALGRALLGASMMGDISPTFLFFSAASASISAERSTPIIS